MTFSPRVSEELVIAGATWRLPPHPSAPHAPWSRSGSTSVVYRLDGAGPSRALKLLGPSWRGPDNAERAVKLKHLASLKGLQVASREVITPDMAGGAAALVGALLMPWIEGYNWSDVVRARTPLTQEQALHLARELASVLDGLEQRNVAHCNLSGNSVMIASGMTPTIELVDLEHLFAIGQPPPQPASAGTPARVRTSGDRPVWEAQADRFAGAIVLAEMLGWCDPAVRAAATQESYFAGEDLLLGQSPERYRVLLERLKATWGERVGRLFEHAWLSEAQTAGPSFRDWLAALPERPGVGPSTAPPGGLPTGPPSSTARSGATPGGPAPIAPTSPPGSQWSPATSAAPPPGPWPGASPRGAAPGSSLAPSRSRAPLIVVLVLVVAAISAGGWYLATRRAGAPVPGLEKVDMPSPSFSSSPRASGAPPRPSASAAPSSSASPSAAPSSGASPSAAPSSSASSGPAPSPSGSPAATATPASGGPVRGSGRITDAQMCRGVDATGKAVDAVTTYDPFVPFFCAFRVPNGKKGTVVTARWQDPQGFSRTTTATISTDGESYLYVKLEPTPAFTMGPYAVSLELNGKVEQEVRFKVSATGK